MMSNQQPILKTKATMRQIGHNLWTFLSYPPMYKPTLKSSHYLLIRLLLSCKATSVYTSVDGVVGPAVDLLHIAFQMWWVQIHMWMFGKIIEFIIEHFCDL